ncbi:MAG: uncharacterized protein PWP65_1748 [Clostridia bacterium]|nr:uncharacterized protein [Clostridia bacterium]
MIYYTLKGPGSTLKSREVGIRVFMYRLYAIADLHLSGANPKPMDIFGPLWQDHQQKIEKNWPSDERDVIIVGGDISWAMSLEEALVDLKWLDGLPGRKILLRGNHDYWWKAIGRLRSLPLKTIFFLQNDHFLLPDGRAICGTRGWNCPGDPLFEADPENNGRIYRREIERLRLSLESARRAGARRATVALHFPPCSDQANSSGFIELMEDYPVDSCIFGHIHGAAQAKVFQGFREGIKYFFVAAEYLHFRPLRIL